MKNDSPNRRRFHYHFSLRSFFSVKNLNYSFVTLFIGADQYITYVNTKPTFNQIILHIYIYINLKFSIV